MPLLLTQVSGGDLPRQLNTRAKPDLITLQSVTNRKGELSPFDVTTTPQQKSLASFSGSPPEYPGLPSSLFNDCNVRQSPLTGLGIVNQPCFNILHDSALSLHRARGESCTDLFTREK